METIAIRIFGSNSCKKCQALKKAFEFYSIGYEYIDVENPANDTLCDERNVEELPKIEAYYPKINKVFYEKTGYVNPLQFIEDSIIETEDLEKQLTDPNAPVPTNYDKAEIQKMMLESQNKKKCNTCSRKNHAK